MLSAYPAKLDFLNGEVGMSNDTAKPAAKQKFAQMTAGGKLLFLGKLVLFLATFGFAYGSLLED